MSKVILETPYAGDVERNKKYARDCLLDSLKRGEYPLASHLLYTQVLDDNIPEERNLGIEAGLAWSKDANYTVCYTDYGISTSMKYGITRAESNGKKVLYRKLYEGPSGYDRITACIADMQSSVWDKIEKDETCELNDLLLEFLIDYKYYGWEIDTNILQLNFTGSSDNFYFISVPPDDLQSYKEYLDEYPVYHVDLEEGKLTTAFPNYRTMMENWFPDDSRLCNLSKNSRKQDIPKIRHLAEDEIITASNED